MRALLYACVLKCSEFGNGKDPMFTTMRAGAATLAVAGALLVPLAAATDAAAASCTPHTTGVCRANSPHPSGATALCKDGEYAFSKHFRGTCSWHKGVKYWYR
jgi:hypothetical protein